MKPAEPSDLREFRPFGAAISKFDDEEEIVPERKCRQPRWRDEDTAMTEADPSESPEELQTIDVSSQLFLTFKRMQVEEQLQLTGGVYLGGGHFARPDQNCERSPDSGIWCDSQDDDRNSRETTTSKDEDEDSEDEEVHAAKAERRRKEKQAVPASSGKFRKLCKVVVAESPTAEAATPEAEVEAPTVEAPPKHRETLAADLLVLSDGDDPVPNLEHVKFNLANQVPLEVLLEARENHNATGESSAQTDEEQDRDIIKVKFESYWERRKISRERRLRARHYTGKKWTH